MITFFVPGIPAPQGSKRHVGRGILVEASKRLAPWRQTVTVFAQNAMQSAGMAPAPPKVPVQVDVMFVFKRLSATPKREFGRTPMVAPPDIDKLLRGILDAMTGVCFNDDGQVNRVTMDKCRAAPDEQTGAHITVTWEVPE